MAALPYMQLFVADYLADTAHLNAAQHGAYLLLIMNYWQRGKPLKNCNERLANVARMSNDEWNANKNILAEFFDITPEEWSHKRIEVDLRKVESKSTKAKQSRQVALDNKENKPRSTNVKRTFNHTDTEADTNTDNKQIKKEVSTPTGVPPETWQAFRQMRVRIKKPLTAHAEKLAFSKLDEFRGKGHDPTGIVNYSIMNSYPGLYEPKENHANRNPKTQSAAHGGFEKQDYLAGSEGFDVVTGNR